MGQLHVTGTLDAYYGEPFYCVVYDPQITTWKRLEDMRMERHFHSCVVFAGKVVVTWGLYGHFVERSVRRMSILTTNGRSCPI